MTQNVEKLATNVTHDIEYITPQMAAAYLETAAINRRLSETSVGKYKSAMERGQWDLSQPICFDIDGHLIDGQHRLHAVIQSGVPHYFNTLRGLKNSLHMDVGRARKPSDILTMLGYKNTNVLAAVARLIILMETRPNMSPVPHGSAQAYITIDDIIDRVKSDPDIIKVANEVSNKARHKQLGSMMKSSAIAGWFIYCLKHGMDDDTIASDFFAELYGNLPGAPDNPAIVLYRTLNSVRADRRNLSKRDRAAYLVKAWNAYYENRPMNRLFFRSFGKKAEKFPTLKLDRDIDTAGVQ